jgi:hypothetical protein
VGRRISRRGQRIARWATPLPLRSANRSMPVHAQGKISAGCFFCGNFLAAPCHLMLRRYAYMRGQPTRSHAPEGFRRRNCSAEKPHPATRQIRANRVAFSLPQDSSLQLMFETCVNRRPELSVFRDVGFRLEYAPRVLASRSNALQAIERASESPRLHARYLGRAAQALPSTRFSATNDALRSRKTSPIATGLPQRAQFSPQEIARARVNSRCALSASTNVGLVLDPIPQSRFCRKRCSVDSRKRRPSRSAFRISCRAARGSKTRTANPHSE